jgi:hypothetical protein
VFYQQDENPEDASTPTQARPYSVTAFGGYAVGGSWSGVWGSNVTTKAAASYNTKSVNGHFGVFDNYLYEGPSTSVCDSVFLSAGRWSCSASLVSTGGTGSISAQPSTKLTMSADLTYYKTGWAGTHELQTGIFLQPRLVFTSTTRYLNNGLTSENVVLRQAGNPSSGTVPYYRIQYDRTEQLTRDLQASDYAIYVQDSWKPSPRLTINGGIRLDWVKASDAIFDLEAQSSLEFGPRFGATYLLTADNANIIRFSAGRIHDIPQSGYLPNTGSSQAGYTEFYDLNLDGTFETAFVTPATTALSAAREIDPERHQSFTDEYIVGYRRQLPGQVALDVSWIRRYYRDMPALVEINHIYDGVRFTGLRDESQNSILRVTNNTWNTPVYTGLEITGTKRAKNMQVLVTYSRQWQHLDGTWQPIDPASFIQPGHFANDKGIGSIRGNETNSLSGTSMTRSPSWQDHVLRIGGSYQTFWDVMVASSFSYQSGPFSGPVVTRIAAPDPQFGPPTIVTSTGRTVSNPLATTIRFAYSDRGEGQIKAPNLVVWNLRFGKTFSFRGQSVEAAVDIFNVTNRGAAQQFLGGGNQLYSANYAVAPDGSFRGTSLQFARSSQLLLRYTF